MYNHYHRIENIVKIPTKVKFVFYGYNQQELIILFLKNNMGGYYGFYSK